MEIINDSRLTPTMELSRSGSNMLFREKNPDDRSFIGHENADFVLKHDRKEFIAFLGDDSRWYWKSDCNQCNGQPRSGFAYVECDEHDVCRTCNIHRSKLTESPWGGSAGWQCKSCNAIEHEDEKTTALAAMPEEYSNWDFHNVDEITCPYCAYQFTDSWECSEHTDETEECPRCDTTFTYSAEITLTFNCDRID